MRVIARLDIKNEFVIKGINFEGLRKIGEPIELAKKYYNQKIDEIIFIDCVASLYGRNQLFDIIKKSTEEIFCPITVGGGIRSLKDMKSYSNQVRICCNNFFATENQEFIKSK